MVWWLRLSTCRLPFTVCAQFVCVMWLSGCSAVVLLLAHQDHVVAVDWIVLLILVAVGSWSYLSGTGIAAAAPSLPLHKFSSVYSVL